MKDFSIMSLNDVFNYIIEPPGDIVVKNKFKDYIIYISDNLILNSKSESLNYFENYEEAVKIAKSNIGYYAGYYGEDVRERVERVLDAPHPILGSVNIKRTPDEIFRMGMEWGVQGKPVEKTFHIKFPSLNKH